MVDNLTNVDFQGIVQLGGKLVDLCEIKGKKKVYMCFLRFIHEKCFNIGRNIKMEGKVVKEALIESVQLVYLGRHLGNKLMKNIDVNI